MKYIGNGEFYPGIPARDLSDEEVAHYGLKVLLKTGLYIEEKIKVIKDKASVRSTKHDSNIIDQSTDW